MGIQGRVRIKICGITRLEDALAAVHAGADAIGLVFYANSPRVVSPQLAREICTCLPPFVSKVGLFVNAPRKDIAKTLETVPLDLLQFHGDEAPEDCRGYSKPYIKAVRMQDHVKLADEVGQFSDASALLLDAFMEGVYGGTGQVFDWERPLPEIGKPLILAGGLTVENVAAAIRQIKPYAVDVSGGVESVKGIKDAAKIAEFIREVRNAKY